ncbi:MAG: DegT/DnrJ/EryC1/StrS family aminotransferase [Deltaproteobacteria bacterium]|nr:DegT/DnrJ/EryC1/StrS family aminotransferase [Deltaproteobacteria bacterium]
MAAIPFIDLQAQQERIRPQLDAAIKKVLAHGKYILGPEVTEVEEKLAAFTGAAHCVTVASGTEALLISLMALGIGPGDEVITTPFTFVATAEVIVLTGAKPVFVDVEADTCNIDAQQIEAAITDKTRAIIPVSLYGQPADMDEINAIAEKHTNIHKSSGAPLASRPITVIEDAAQSFGATYKGVKSGHLSAIGCTSFFPSKPLGCYGDGGAIFTSDDALAQACRELRVHGQSKRYVHTRIGVGGRMDTLQCAVLLAKLDCFGWEIEQRLAIGGRYNRLLDEAGIPRVRQRSDRTSVFAQYTVFIEERERLQEELKKAGIPTAVHYPLPLNEQPAYKGNCGGGATPVAADLARRVMSLPMSAYLRENDQRNIVETLAAARQF